MVTVIKMLNLGTYKQLFVGNPMPIHVSRAASDGLRFVVEISLIENGTVSTVEQVLACEGVFVGNECILDIANFLRSYVSSATVDITTIGVQYATQMRKRFTIAYSVKQEDGTVVESGSEATTFEAFLGTEYEELWASSNFVNMLTHQPAAQKISLAQLAYTYLFGCSNGVQINVTCTVYHFVGANTVLADSVGSNLASVKTTTIIPLMHLLSSIDLQSVWRIHVSFLDTVTGITTARTFDIDRNYRRQARLFLFENSLGGMDTVCFTGEQVQTTEVDTRTIEQGRKYNYTPSSSSKKAAKSNFTQKFKVETGYKTRPELQYLSRELMQSERVFEIVQDATPYLRAINIETKKFEYEQDSVQPQSVTLEYTYAL